MKYLFSQKKYLELIEFFKNLNYEFKFFHNRILPTRNIILRHDVDFDTELDVGVANINDNVDATKSLMPKLTPPPQSSSLLSVSS